LPDHQHLLSQVRVKEDNDEPARPMSSILKVFKQERINKVEEEISKPISTRLTASISLWTER
jgi:hypothetical protein